MVYESTIVMYHTRLWLGQTKPSSHTLQFQHAATLAKPPLNELYCLRPLSLASILLKMGWASHLDAGCVHGELVMDLINHPATMDEGNSLSCVHAQISMTKPSSNQSAGELVVERCR